MMDALNSLNVGQLAIVAFFVEALIQTLKPLYDKKTGWNKNGLFSLVIGITISVLTSVDLFKQVGLTIPFPNVGSVLTGIIASRGSNVFHDVFKVVQNQAVNSESQSGGVG
jgi:hypothetical protein